MLPSIFVLFIRHSVRYFRAARDFSVDQRKRLRNDVLAVKGLMPLLMKPRNGGRWTLEDREQLRACLKRLSVASPYLLVLLMPGGIFFLPVLAWWLDRRRRNRDRRAATAQRPVP